MQIDCPICLELPIEPVMGSCGHTICTPCQKKIKTNKCPVCNQTKITYQKNFSLRDVVQKSNPEEYDRRYAEWISNDPEPEPPQKKRKVAKTVFEIQKETVSESSGGDLQLMHKTTFSRDDIRYIVRCIMNGNTAQNVKSGFGRTVGVVYTHSDERSYSIGSKMGHSMILTGTRGIFEEWMIFSTRKKIERRRPEAN